MNQKPKTKVDELKEALRKKHEALDAAAANAVPPQEEPSDELAKQIHAAEEEAKNHYDKLLRVMAEFENFKKRMAKEREEQFKYSNERLLSELLPALDDLDRVLDHVPVDAPEDVKKIAEGVELVRKSLLAALEKFGLRQVEAEDSSFDPAHHEAIAAIESEAHKPGHVAAVHRKGYWLHDRLLRPAMVTVAKDRDKTGE